MIKLFISAFPQAQVKEAQDALNTHKATLKAYSEQIGARDAEKRDLNKENNQCDLDIQQMEHKIAKFQKDSKDTCRYVSI